MDNLQYERITDADYKLPEDHTDLPWADEDYAVIKYIWSTIALGLVASSTAIIYLLIKTL